MIRHGAATREHRSPEWLSWRAMRQRCNDPGHSDYANYGGRGITVAKAWNSFAQFLADMGKRPPGMSLERRNNNRGYSAANCKWATRSEQARNRRPAHRDDIGRFAPSETNHQQQTRIAG